MKRFLFLAVLLVCLSVTAFGQRKRAGLIVTLVDGASIDQVNRDNKTTTLEHVDGTNVYLVGQDGDAVQAVAACDRFIKLHPNHPNVDYVYYLRGLANFADDLGMLGYLGGQDLSERDPKAARDAFDAFRELATRHPDSRYAPDAVARMNYLLNALASHEVHVARYYMKRSAFVAAANRAQYALKTYPQAPANEEGLVILVRAYDALGLKDLRDDAERVLNKNFPRSKYLKGNGKSGTPWWQVWNWGSSGQ